MIRLAGVCMLVLSGCATTQVSLLEGEEGAETGAVAVLDPDSEGDVRVLDRASSRTAVRQRSVSTRVAGKRKPEARYAPLLGSMPERPRRFEFYFEGDSTRLIAESQALLPALFAEVQRRPAADVDIIGHTDTVGEDSYNTQLSVRRAAEISGALTANGFAPDHIRAIGRGEQDLRVQTADEASALLNRRVEVYVK